VAAHGQSMTLASGQPGLTLHLKVKHLNIRTVSSISIEGTTASVSYQLTATSYQRSIYGRQASAPLSAKAHALVIMDLQLQHHDFGTVCQHVVRN